MVGDQPTTNPSFASLEAAADPALSRVPSLRRVALLLLLTAVYYAAGRFGLSLSFVNNSVSPIWPPAGLAIAACLVAGTGVWPAVFAGAFLVNLATTSAIAPSLLIAAGNTMEMLAAVWVIRRFGGGAAAFDTTAGIFVFVTASVSAAAIAASVGLAALLLAHLAPASDAAMVWLTWWTGDLSGALLVAPALMLWGRPPRYTWWTHRGEALMLVVSLVAANYFVFGPTVAGVRNYPLMFFVLPNLLWAALRFGRRAAMVSILMTSAVATAGTLHSLGPFGRGTPGEALLLLQAYLSVSTVAVLTLAVEVSRRRAVEAEMRALNRDLSGRVDARSEELQRLHGRLVEAQHVAHIGSWEWDVRSNAIWWSDEMYRVYGIPVGTPVTFERYVSMIHPDDRQRVQETVAESRKTGYSFTFEHRAIAPDGAVRVLYSHGRVVMDDRGEPIRMMGVGHDITERRRAEEERIELAREQAARREAEEASRMKDQFLATLSHELRTPLNAVLGWAQMLKTRPDDAGLRDRAIDAIQRNVSIQAQLVSDILDVARIRTGMLSIDVQPVPLRAIVDGALEIMQPAVESRGIAVALSIAPDIVVIGDQHRLQQVFWNLLSNAVKFAPASGHVAVRATRYGDAINVEVTDDGPGIADEFLPHVFEQFTQADASVTRQHGGLGLGLAISRDLVKLHHGTIVAANRAEGGAVFTVRLPAAQRAAVEKPGGN